MPTGTSDKDIVTLVEKANREPIPEQERAHAFYFWRDNNYVHEDDFNHDEYNHEDHGRIEVSANATEAEIRKAVIQANGSPAYTIVTPRTHRFWTVTRHSPPHGGTTAST